MVERTFYTGDGAPKWTSTAAIENQPDLPVGPHLWGVPAPAVKLTCTASSGPVVDNLGKHQFFIPVYVVEALTAGDSYKFVVSGKPIS